MKNLEAQHQSAYFARLALNEKKHPQLRWIFAVPNGGFRHKATAARLRAEGVRSGIADICIPIPTKHYHGAWIELKIAPNKPTEAQKAFLEAMSNAGYFAAVAWSVDDLIEMTENYLGVRL